MGANTPIRSPWRCGVHLAWIHTLHSKDYNRSLGSLPTMALVLTVSSEYFCGGSPMSGAFLQTALGITPADCITGGSGAICTGFRRLWARHAKDKRAKEVDVAPCVALRGSQWSWARSSSIWCRCDRCRVGCACIGLGQ